MPVDPQVQVVLDLLGSLGLSQLSDVPYDQLRALTLEMSKQRPPDDVAAVRDISAPGPGGDISIRLYRPIGSTEADRLGCLVYMHGGGWTIGSVESYDGLCRTIANRAGVAVASIEYRLGPEHRYPAAVDDCWAATKWIAANAASLGIDAARLAVGGDSAGGNLAAIVTLLARDSGGPALKHQALIYPAVDARMTAASIDENAKGFLLTKADMIWFYGHYVGDQKVDPTDWHISPLLHARHDGLPSATMITAEFDPLRDEGEEYRDVLRRAGVAVEHTRYDGMVHGFFGMGDQIDAGNMAVSQVASALKRSIG